MVRGVRSQVDAYLAVLHDAPEFVGVRDLHRRFARNLGTERTLSRWRKRLAPMIRSFPTFTVEALGLAHLHLFIAAPDDRWAEFPYVVELVWGSDDFVRPLLYAHCLVPIAHLAQVLALLEVLRHEEWCSDVVMVRTWSGTQHLDSCRHLDGGEHRSLPIAGSLLAQQPLVVPVIAESWNQNVTLPSLWTAIHGRLGASIRSYLPRRRLLLVNGKRYVRDAYQALTDAGLFRQQVVRRTDLLPDQVEFVIVGFRMSDRFLELVASLRAIAAMIETYWIVDGGALLRVAGPARLLEVLLAGIADMPVDVAVMVVDRGRSRIPVGRFRYDLLFDPRTGWRFDRARILEHLHQ